LVYLFSAENKKLIYNLHQLCFVKCRFIYSEGLLEYVRFYKTLDPDIIINQPELNENDLVVNALLWFTLLLLKSGLWCVLQAVPTRLLSLAKITQE
jgi:hypothetical protein